MKIFRRQDSHKKKRINPRWRSARGLQSKIRLAKRGYMKKPKIGYGSPKKSELVQVASLKELKDVIKGESIIIKKIGLKKKIELVKEAVKLKITIININVEKFLKESESRLKLRKDRKKKLLSEKTEKKDKAKKKAEKKEKEEKIEEKVEKTEEEIKKEKEQEKKEKDKILTTKKQ
ncbi:hypothetical protein KY313_00310 [Candidatus Woesearchaeota archaeon]|jgi:large subunit ribosomal protein L32e|nr:hypothetical protein [Candidatus Woesearchaeota archaeon]